MRIQITYDRITSCAVRNGRCPGCGKRVRRTRTFEQTVSPFNRVRFPDGSKGRPRTAGEVQIAVDRQAAAWAPDPETFRHDTCRTR